MSRVVPGLVLPLALAIALLATGRTAAQDCAAPPPAYYPPAVSYYAPPSVSYYSPPAVSYYAPPETSYYAPPAVSYYAAPAVSYYAPPAYAPATVTTRYGLFGRPRVTVAQYYAP